MFLRGDPLRHNMSRPRNPSAFAAAALEAFGLASARAWAGPLLWYSYRDLGTDSDDPEEWFGLNTEAGDQKAAYATFQTLAGK